MKKFLFSSFFMMNIFTLFSQTKGIILDAFDAPINEVSILLQDQNIMIYSNEDGEFVTKLDIPKSSYIYFYKQGYSSKTLKYNSDLDLKIILYKLHVNLDEIGVTESFNILGSNKLSSIEKRSLKDDFSSSSSMIENIAQLSQKYLEIDLLAYNLSQIHKLNHKDGEFLIKNKTQKESTTNNFKKNLPIIVKTEFTKKVKKTKTEIKKLHAIYSNPKLLPGEIKAKVAKEINIKRKELSDVYNSPKEVLSFEKAGKRGCWQ